MGEAGSGESYCFVVGEVGWALADGQDDGAVRFDVVGAAVVAAAAS